ncbi:MAG: deoxyribose-phosphate aldolase [Bryobacteraceae bacterium]|nr:deoxyribose-phosphate aldolase [Bryobacteraceae bacterium]
MDCSAYTEPRPPLRTYEDLAKMIDHSLVRPDLSEQQVEEGCRIAREYGVASVSVRPSDVDLVVKWLRGSGVKVGSIAGFPHGSSTTPAKLYEIRDLLRRGVEEIDMVLNIGKMISRQFQYVEMEIHQAAQACHEAGAILKVIFENCYLTEDLKVIACKICNRCEVDFVKTSTAYGDGGYTLEDLKLMRKYCAPEVGVKAAGGVRTLEKVFEVYEAGCTRIGATQTVKLLEDWKAHLARQAAESASMQA